MGYETRLTFTREWPTDGVWLQGGEFGPLRGQPIVAVEVVVSESKKVRSGSVATLEYVSPLLGVILVQDEEIRRRLSRTKSPERVEAELRRLVETMQAATAGSRQRIEVWTMSMLRLYLDLHAGPARALLPSNGARRTVP